MTVGVRARLAKLESRAVGNTPQRVALARICTLLAQSLDPDAPAVRPEDLPPQWTYFGDLVAASYAINEVEPQSENPPAGP